MKSYLSPKKQRFVDFIQTFTDSHGCPPTFAEIMDGLHIKSPGTVNWYVNELEQAGVLERSKGYSGKRALIINPVIINGETPTGKSKSKKVKLSRQQEIDKYQAKEGFNVIIMSPIAAGFGLNITEANHVIHYTRHWNPAKEQQATDRAYRIGQKKDVKVHYPMAVAPDDKINTFDLILNELLSRKSNLASNTLFPTEQIEINKSDFLNSLDNSSETANILLNNITDLDKLKPLMFEAAIALLLERKYNGYSKLTPVSNDKGADIIFFGDEFNLLIQVKQSINYLGIASGQEIQIVDSVCFLSYILRFLMIG